MNPGAFKPTPEQEAVVSCDGSAFVMACPGAGKTRVLAECARRLFTVMPAGRGAAFLSFTQAAIFELETRLRKERILPSPVFPSFIGTFDSFVWQFLVAPFGIEGSDSRPRLIADLAGLLVTPFQGAHPLPLACFHPVTAKIIDQAAKVQGFDVSQKSANQVQAYETAAAAVRRALRTSGQLGFDEARDTALERLNDTEVAPRIAAALANRFCEVIVDEAQDCSPGDLQIVSWLRNSGLPVKIVCDPHQSIYEFRGGVTDQLFAYQKTFQEDERKVLTGNFRSTPNICKAIAQLRRLGLSTAPDEALGPHKDDTTPVRILSYAGKGVPSSIGSAFCGHVSEMGIDITLSPVVAATRTSGAAAVGQPRPSNSRDRTIRLAEAVTSFHFASGFNDMKTALEQVHQILLELEGHLEGVSYRQYLVQSEIDEASWRPLVISILRALRFDPSKHADAKAWHAAAKALLNNHLTMRDGTSLSQKLRWNNDIPSVLVNVPAVTAMPRTIHSVKGMQFPAVCVITTAATLKSIIDYLETGEPADRAEETRKLYVAASRAKRLLVIAAPKSQAGRLAGHLRSQGAAVEIEAV